MNAKYTVSCLNVSIQPQLWMRGDYSLRYRKFEAVVTSSNYSHVGSGHSHQIFFVHSELSVMVEFRGNGAVYRAKVLSFLRLWKIDICSPVLPISEASFVYRGRLQLPITVSSNNLSTKADSDDYIFLSIGLSGHWQHYPSSPPSQKKSKITYSSTQSPSAECSLSCRIRNHPVGSLSIHKSLKPTANSLIQVHQRQIPGSYRHVHRSGIRWK